MKNSEKILEFLSFCVEMYAVKYQMSGRDVLEKFDAHQTLEFLQSGYEALHTLGRDQILWEIDDYLSQRESV